MELCFQTADAGGCASLDAQVKLVRLLAPNECGTNWEIAAALIDV
jgi:hypothetical protein